MTTETVTDQQRLTALLNTADADRAALVTECRAYGIPLLGPDINRSKAEFTITEYDSIRFGLLAIRDVGPAAAAAIVAGCRYRDYTSFYDFVDRMPAELINRRTLLALVRAGAFDSLGHPRQGLADVVAELVEDPDSRPAIGTEEWARVDLLEMEREVLGVYLTGHPLDGMDHLLKPFTDVTVADLAGDSVPDGAVVRVAGRIAGCSRHVTGQGRAWTSVTFEDVTGTIEALVMPKQYKRCGGWIAPTCLVAFRARVDRSAGECRLVVERLYAPDAEVEDELSGYGPDTFLYVLADRVMLDAPGEVLAGFVPRVLPDATEKAVSVATMRALRVHLAELMLRAARDFQDGRSCDVGYRNLGLTDSWMPSAFFWSLARRMAGVVWPNYTRAQRDRMRELAAQVAEQHAAEWLRNRSKPATFTAAEHDAMSDKVRWAFTEQSCRTTEARRRGDMLAAYLHTHPAGEIVQDDLDELLLQVERGLPVERPFF